MGGDLPFLFSNAGARLATPVTRLEPAVTGPDNVSTSFFGMLIPQDGSFPAFQGTSAATPHVAAAAALLLQQNPTWTPAQVAKDLESTAIPIPAGSTGWNDVAGYGMIQLTTTSTGTGGTGSTGGAGSASALVAYNPLRIAYDPATQTYDGNITLTNPTNVTQTGSFEVVFSNLPAGVTVVNASGHTASGLPFIDVDVTLAPLQNVRLPVEFTDPLNQPFGNWWLGAKIQVLVGQME